MATVADGASPQEAVEVEAADLVRLMELGRSTALDMEEMLADSSEGLEKIDAICKWAGLDEAERERLIEVLKRAARERDDWEKNQVRVEKAAGEAASWVLHFPADDGGLHAKLRRELAAGFTAEKAEKIEQAGNLRDFSYCRFLDLPLVDCAVKVKARRLDAQGPALFGDYVRFKIAPVPTNNWQEVDLPAQALAESTHPSARLVHLLGNMERVLEEATEAAGEQ